MKLEFTARRRSGASPRSRSQVNEKTENIGARRLYTVMEKLLEDVSFAAGRGGAGGVTIDAAYVDTR